MASREFTSVCLPQQSSVEQTNRYDVNSNPRLNHKRNLANLRERKRMMLINKGFELLRNRLPIRQLIDNDPNIDMKTKFKSDRWAELNTEDRQKLLIDSNGSLRLTKVDILKLTIEYIKLLNKILSGSTEQASTLSLSFDQNHHNRTSKRSNSSSKKYNRDRCQNQKRGQKQQQQQREISYLRQTNSHLIVYVKPNSNHDDNARNRTIATTMTKKYLLTCSRLVDQFSYNQSMNVDLQSESKRTFNLKDTKLWIPGVE